ncbi:MAG: FAD-dependent oxidoreductase [Bdellovibrionales bacterium]|nr:FAD-dependent oxidoreductase [Bdellovibrionales bacterium]
MARSELFRQLKRALRSPERFGERVDSFLERPIDRRTFLRTTATASTIVAGALYANPRRLLAATPDARDAGQVAIVGAGFAGLTAAYELRKLGVQATVFEASTRTGGRVLTRDAFHQGMFCEMGGELIDRNHRSLLALAAELGVEIEEFPEENSRTADLLYFFDGRVYTDRDLFRAVGPLVERVRADRMSIFGNLEGEVLDCRSAAKFPNALPIDHQSLEQYLDETPGLESWVKRLVGHAYVTEFGLELGNQSALNLHLLIDYDLSDGEFALFGESDESLRVKGGNSRLVEKLTAAVAAGGTPIEYGHRLLALEERGTKVSLQFECPNGSTREFVADRAICAIPFSTLRSVEIRSPMTAPKTAAIRRLAYATHAKAMIGTRDRFWRKRHGSIKVSNGAWLNDCTTQAFWETSRGQAGSGGILTSFRGGRAGTGDLPWNSVVEDFLAPYADSVRARYADTMLEAKASVVWARDPFVQGSYSCPRPGDTTEILGAAEDPEWGGKLVFAGEHASANFGYMDAAVESAIKAVNMLAPSATRFTAGLRGR